MENTEYLEQAIKESKNQTPTPSANMESFFYSMRCQKHNNKIERINLYPGAKNFFLCLDCIVELGEANQKYKAFYVSLKDFINSIASGKFNCESYMVKDIKSKHDQLNKLKIDMDSRQELEETIIDQDIEN